MIALVLVAATGATTVANIGGHVGVADLAVVALGRLPRRDQWSSAPAVLAPTGVGRLLQPLTVFHPEWVGDRIETSPPRYPGSATRPIAILRCFAAR